MYKDALATSQRKFGQPHAFVCAHLDKLNTFPQLKMQNSENFISFSSAISGFVAVFKSLSFNDDLKSVNLLSQAVSKLPPNLKEAWSMHTVRHDWQRPTLLDFNNWLKEKAEGMNDYVYLTLRQKTRNQLNQKQPKVLQPIVRWLVKLRISLSFRLAFCVRVVMHCRTVLFSRKRMLLCEQKT